MLLSPSVFINCQSLLGTGWSLGTFISCSPVCARILTLCVSCAHNWSCCEFTSTVVQETAFPALHGILPHPLCLCSYWLLFMFRYCHMCESWGRGDKDVPFRDKSFMYTWRHATQACTHMHNAAMHTHMYTCTHTCTNTPCLLSPFSGSNMYMCLGLTTWD